MLDACAPGWTKRPTPHKYQVRANGNWPIKLIRSGATIAPRFAMSRESLNNPQMRDTLRQVLMVVVLGASLSATSPASATPIPIGVAAFGAGSTLTTFTGIPFGTEVDGLVVDGIVFDYSFGLSTLDV